MIDVLRAVAAPASVDGPLSVNIADAFLAGGASSSRSFRHRDSFADVLSDLLVLAEGDNGETPLPVDSGCCYCESGRESLVHLGKRISSLTSLLVGLAPATANQAL
jgi:hypothetical protein